MKAIFGAHHTDGAFYRFAELLKMFPVLYQGPPWPAPLYVEDLLKQIHQ